MHQLAIGLEVHIMRKNNGCHDCLALYLVNLVDELAK
jgi:hypothetical protein